VKREPFGAAPILRNGGGFAVVLCVLVFGVWTVVKVATEHLLYQNATSTAFGWAHYVVAGVSDLEEIAAG